MTLSEWLRVVAAAAMSLMIGVTTEGARADQTAVAGGPGGSAFGEHPGIPGTRIAAVQVRGGAWIDAVQVTYEAPDGRRWPSPLHGGSGGNPGRFVLDRDERIVEISGRSGQYVESLRIRTNKRVSPIFGNPRSGGTPYRIAAPAGNTVVGFAGRAGAYVDAIGLVIEPTAVAPTVSGQPPSIEGKVNVHRERDRVTVAFNLSTPGRPEVSLGVGNPYGRCFVSANRVAHWVAPNNQMRHQVVFSKLRLGTEYYYSIWIPGGGRTDKCTTGPIPIITIIDRP